MSFEPVMQALHPIRAVVWGELAIGFLGAGTLLNSFMLVPSESDFDLAAKKLVVAGFRPAPWSYGITDPQYLDDSEFTRGINPMDIPGWRKLDDNSMRFQFPAGVSGCTRVVLLRSSYVGLAPPSDPLSMRRFHCDKNMYYPDKALLLESFIGTLLQDSPGFWRDTLTVWAISYMYGILMLEDTLLDSCDNEQVRLWFNEKIRRGKGGLDRNPFSKRIGRRQAPQF